jgi:hypothetical protein
MEQAHLIITSDGQVFHPFFAIIAGRSVPQFCEHSTIVSVL